MNGFDRAMVAYWRSPDAAAVLAAFVDAPGGGEWRPESVLTAPVFLAHVLDANPDQAPRLVEQVRGGDPVKVEVAAQALNYCNLPDRARLMERLVGEATAAAMDPGGADFASFRPSHPLHVEMMWASFFATGQDLYLDALARLLDGWLPETQLHDLVGRAKTQEDVREQAMAGLLAQAAMATLSAQLPQCPPAAQALARRAAAQDGLSSALAARLLARIQS